MANFNSQWDCLTWPSYDFPYNTIERELSEQPRLVAGSVNTCVTLGGKIAKRYGTVGISGTSGNLPANARIDRLWTYETMDTPRPHVYLVASVAVSNEGMFPLLFGTTKTVWRLYYCNLSANTFWSLAPALRGSNSSLLPHEAAPARGMLFVKSYPSKSVDVLGSVILDGTGGTMVTRPWGSLGPTTPARVVGSKCKLTVTTTSSATSLTVDDTTALPPAPFNIQCDYEILTVTAKTLTTLTVLRGAQGSITAAHLAGTYMFAFPWNASAHPVLVNLGWRYSYAYESVTGNVSNRVDTESNPDNMPSGTGPFLNLCPIVQLVGLADTVNFPYIRVFRTTDGGGNFFQLERIANPGAGTFNYTDKGLASASGNADPLPDSDLDSAIIAPTLESNSPPPSCISPAVVGVDAVQPSTPIAYFGGRMWYAIGNIVFYSGEEEITLGVPEECWPAGTIGNFFRYQHPVKNLQATSNALYIITNQDTHAVTGTNRATFNSNPVFQTIGAPVGHPSAITRYGDSVAWLANDYRIVYAQGSNLVSLSDELGTDLANAINAGAEVQLCYWANLDKEYIVVQAANKTNPTLTRQWVFDIKKSSADGNGRRNFWYAPWNIPATCLASGRLTDTSNQRSLIFANVSGATTFLATYDTTGVAAVDTDTSGASINTYDVIARFPMMMTPAGNHINALRRPGVVPKVEFIQVDRTSYASDKDPDIFWFKDDLWTDKLPLTDPQAPNFRRQAKGYRTLQYPVGEVAQHMAIQLQKLASPDRFELQELMIAFDPTLGS